MMQYGVQGGAYAGYQAPQEDPAYWQQQQMQQQQMQQVS